MRGRAEEQAESPSPMFENRSYKRTFYSAPQSVTSLIAAFMEPTITVAVFLIATRWVGDGTALELVNWQRRALAVRHAIAEEAFAGLPYNAHPQSLHVWLPLPEGHSEEGFVSQARLRGVAIAPGSSFRTCGESWHPAVRISLGSTSEQDLRTGLGILASLASGSPEALLLAI